MKFFQFYVDFYTARPLFFGVVNAICAVSNAFFLTYWLCKDRWWWLATVVALLGTLGGVVGTLGCVARLLDKVR